jgi:hypothetical protein
VEAILVNLWFNLFVVVKFWPIFQMLLFGHVLHKKNQKLLFLQFLGGYLAYWPVYLWIKSADVSLVHSKLMRLIGHLHTVNQGDLLIDYLLF